jgi:hypothetical protein
MWWERGPNASPPAESGASRFWECPVRRWLQFGYGRTFGGLLNTTKVQAPPHRTGFAFRFNTPVKRPLERNKRGNKPEQVRKQARHGTRVKHQIKTPGRTIPAGRNSRVSIS